MWFGSCEKISRECRAKTFLRTLEIFAQLPNHTVVKQVKLFFSEFTFLGVWLVVHKVCDELTFSELFPLFHSFIHIVLMDIAFLSKAISTSYKATLCSPNI